MIPSDNFEYDTPVTVSCNLQVAKGALPCDAYHHYYHYQSSTQYLWLARTLFALELHKEAMGALEKALFQDHFNEAALALKVFINAEMSLPSPAGRGKGGGIMRGAFPTDVSLPASRSSWGEEHGENSYAKHPLSDAAFCASIGEAPNAATHLHDEAIEAWNRGEYEKAKTLFEKALKLFPNHSNSFLGLGRCHYALNQFAEAKTILEEAIRLSHIAHGAYHASASHQHVLRGDEFVKNGELDLAINEYTKALDLDRGNSDALLKREKLYSLRRGS